MKRSNLENPTERDAIETVLRGLASFQEPAREKWIAMVATTAISVLHGTYGREFTEGYLNGALKSLDDPSLSAPIEVVEKSGTEH